jgi:SagB-type dehydrogenase family enzyme
MILLSLAFIAASQLAGERRTDTKNMDETPAASDAMKLPEPNLKGSMSLEETLLRRRSIREFKREEITLSDLAQLLWAAQGITDLEDLRTAPSAGALYPLELYVVSERVQGLEPGVYKYVPKGHRLVKTTKGTKLGKLADDAYGQSWIRDASAAIVITAIYERTTGKYGERGIRYAHIEVGCAAQNIALQAVALGLGTTVVGAFEDADVAKSVGLASDERPLAIMPIGKP